MKYNLNLPRDRFDGMDRLTRSVLRGSGELHRLRLITQDSYVLPEDSQDYVRENTDALAVTFRDGNEFDIWVSPALRTWDNDFAVDTILHELSHGYLGCYKHGDRFRRFFGRTLHHYSTLVEPIDSGQLVTDMVTRYSRADEVDKDMEMLFLAKASIDEEDYVARTYDGLSKREKTFA